MDTKSKWKLFSSIKFKFHNKSLQNIHSIQIFKLDIALMPMGNKMKLFIMPSKKGIYLILEMIGLPSLDLALTKYVRVIKCVGTCV